MTDINVGDIFHDKDHRWTSDNDLVYIHIITSIDYDKEGNYLYTALEFFKGQMDKYHGTSRFRKWAGDELSKMVRVYKLNDLKFTES